MRKDDAANMLAHVIHDGSSRSTRCAAIATGTRESRSETGAWSREGPRRTGTVRGGTEWRARLHAAVAAGRLVAAANPRLQQKCS